MTERTLSIDQIQAQSYFVKAQRIYEWIIEVLEDEDIPNDDLSVILRDSKLLCRLINEIKPGSIPKQDYEEELPNHKILENIETFIGKCREFRIPEDMLFASADLFDAKNMSAVVNCLCYLKQLVEHNKIEGLNERFLNPVSKKITTGIWNAIGSLFVQPFVVGLMFSLGLKTGRTFFVSLFTKRVDTK